MKINKNKKKKNNNKITKEPNIENSKQSMQLEKKIQSLRGSHKRKRVNRNQAHPSTLDTGNDGMKKKSKIYNEEKKQCFKNKKRKRINLKDPAHPPLGFPIKKEKEEKKEKKRNF